MGREVVLRAIRLWNDLDSKKWDKTELREKMLTLEEANTDPAGKIITEGYLIIGCSSTSLIWIDKASKEHPKWWEFGTNGDEDIYAAPELLQEAILKYWKEWHKEDGRYPWSQGTIKDFFSIYSWAIIYLDVY